ncbi:MAG: SNF2-related protein [Erysipelotrichaceae bacterium]|nr:SNF2-related protein [Erysipelotrichaceae bacterium]
MNAENILNPLNLKMARYYLKNDAISIIEKGNGNHFRATVKAFSTTNHCGFVIKNNQLSSYYCDCPYCIEGSPCGHIGAVLLKMDKVKLPYYYDKQTDIKRRLKEVGIKMEEAVLQEHFQITNDFIKRQKELFQLNLETELVQTQYEIEPILNGLELRFRIGNEKKYLITNLSTFLHDIYYKRKRRYKDIEFVHDESVFDAFAIKQMRFIQSCININSKYGDRYIYKSITLEENILDDFFDLYYGYDSDTFTLEKYGEKVHMNIDDSKDHYVLSLTDSYQYIFGNRYAYVYDETYSVFTRIEGDKQGILRNLVKTLSQDNLIVTKEEFPLLVKYVFSNIEDDVDLLLPSDISYNIYQQIQIYADINDDNQVIVRLDYLNDYGQIQPGFDLKYLTNYQQDLVENYIQKYMDIDYDNHIAYQDINEAHDFIDEGLIFLQKYGIVYESEELRKLRRKSSFSFNFNIGFNSHLLEISIHCQQLTNEEIIEVLKQYRRKKKFYRLNNGRLINLDSPELQEVSGILDEYQVDLRNIEDGVMQLDTYHAFSLDKEKFQYIKMERQESFNELIHNFNYPITNTIPDYYENILRDYQKDGIAWMQTLRSYGLNGILADDMGLGKTLQVIVLLESITSDLPSLVVCPASLIYNWENEIKKFSKTLKVGCIVKGQYQRESMIDHYSDYDVLVTSYDYIRRDIDFYEDKQFEYVILDEAQYIKNRNTKNAKYVNKLNGLHRLALTGTPIENSLAELWSIFDFLMPQYLYDYKYFALHYENEIVVNHSKEKTKQLKKLISPFILRRNKKDVLKELPDKIEVTQYIEFNDDEYPLYMANLQQANKEIRDAVSNNKANKMIILSMLTKLRQICCEPRLIFDNIHEPSSKLKACIEIIEDIEGNKQKVLVFSSFKSMLKLIEIQLKYRGISYYMLTGDTNKEMRKDLVNKFQSDKTTVFLISLKAGGTGLNLTAAQAVIHYDPWWNISAQNQATDRVYRIGQENKVQVFKLVMKDSIEEKILDLQVDKKRLADTFVEGNEDILSHLTQEELLKLFEIEDA